jgi:hypothetical protein
MEFGKSHLKVFNIGGKFPMWKYGMEIFFRVKKLQRIVDGTIPCPKLANIQPEIDEWTNKDNKARMLIYEACI